MRAKGNATAAVETDEGFTDGVEVDRLHRAGLGTLSTADAEIFANDYAASFALREGTRRTVYRARSRIADQTVSRLEPGG